MSENIFLKQAKEELAHLSGDPDFQRLVESREGMLRDIYCFKEEALETGLEEGRKKGLEEGRKYNVPYNVPNNVDTIKEGYPKLCA